MPSFNFPLKYPPFNVRVKNSGGNVMIFDQWRKRWLALTPEEWVRQHLVNFLVVHKKFPSSRIALEKEIIINDVKKRFDVVVYDNEMKPFILAECKAPYIELDIPVIEQALRYNLNLRSQYVMITNGISDFILKDARQVNELPLYI
jgi:hypothetical protein